MPCAALAWSHHENRGQEDSSFGAPQLPSGIRTKRPHPTSRMLSLRWLRFYRRAVGTTAARGTTVFRDRTRQTLPVTRPNHRRAAAPALEPALPAVGQTSSLALARREPRTREGEGETTASEWSFPRRGAGAKPRALIVTLDTLASSRVLKRNCLRGSRRNLNCTTSVGGISAAWKTWGGAVPCCGVLSSGPDPAIA